MGYSEELLLQAVQGVVLLSLGQGVTVLWLHVNPPKWRVTSIVTKILHSVVQELFIVRGNKVRPWEGMQLCCAEAAPPLLEALVS